MVGTILKVILFLYIMPCLVGEGVSRLLKISRTIVKDYLIGNIFIWALFQLVTVPLVLMKQKFSLLVIIINIILFGICAIIVFQEVVLKKCSDLSWKQWKKRLPKMNTQEMISMIIMEAMIVALLFAIIFLQHTDADDSRFVVNAVEILRTDRMFLTDLITGQELEIWIGEMVKDVTSPWAVYIAYYAKMTGIPVVIVAHSILPIMLVLCAMSTFWLISKEFLQESILNRSIFMSLIILLNIYGYYSVYTVETFMLTRIWQGKSTVACIAIPAMFLTCMWLYENERHFGYYILVALLDVGMCLMSGMGVVIGAVMLGSFGAVYGICKREIRISLVMWAMCIPNVAYYVLNEMQPEIMVW